MSEQNIEIIVNGKEVSDFDKHFYLQILPIYKLGGKSGKLVVDTDTGVCAVLTEAV